MEVEQIVTQSIHRGRSRIMITFCGQDVLIKDNVSMENSNSVLLC